MLESKLLIAEVRTIGRNLFGDEGFSLAELLGISLITAAFQADGILPSMTTLLKRSRRAGRSDRQRFGII